MYRIVYDYDENAIVKIKKPWELLYPNAKNYRKSEKEYDLYYQKNNPNLNEWKNWLKIKDTEFAKYFCPCIEYRKDGSLLMKKVQMIDWSKINYKTLDLPNFFSRDEKRRCNLGMLDDRVVCFDYEKPFKKGKFNKK